MQSFFHSSSGRDGSGADAGQLSSQVGDRESSQLSNQRAWHRYQLAAAAIVFSLGIFVSGFGLWHLYTSVGFVPPEELRGVSICQEPETDLFVIIDVSGAVASPGIYSLPALSRIGDALDLAGGLDPQADQYFVRQQLNLASLVRDGEKVYVPYASERVVAAGADTTGATTSVATTDSAATTTLTTTDSAATATAQQSGNISINTATDAQLQTLPGIGPARASKIIENRPYSSVHELTERGVISAGIFESIGQLISL